MIEYTAKKTWNGFVSVRDYIVKSCIEKRKDLKIVLDGEYMIVPYPNLTNSLQLVSHPMRSKFDGKPYMLYDFRWQPFREEAAKQNTLF